MIPQLEQLESRDAPSAFLTPAQVSTAYQFPSMLAGAGQTIAIVDAYDDPTLQGDVAAFDQRFGLPAPPQLLAVTTPGLAGGTGMPEVKPSMADQAQATYSDQQLWGIEIALDVEWAHAMAPGANIVVIQSPDDALTNMLMAVDIAATLPVSVVSMSWGMPETPLIPLYGMDQFFSGYDHPVSFVAASGDWGWPAWPASNPNVIGVGGTILNADGAETPWGPSGSGLSAVENEPAYQLFVQQSGQRLVPDVSYNAGMPISIYAGGAWLGVEGTSCGAPQWAALVSIMDEARQLVGKAPLDSGTQLLTLLYLLPESFFHETGVGRGSPDATLLALAGVLL